MENQFRDILLYPTLEIDLILKTSQLSRPDAMKSFYQKTNLVFIQEDDLEVSFMEMLTKYSKNYEDYETTCGCRQCQSRKRDTESLSTTFGRTNSVALEEGVVVMGL